MKQVVLVFVFCPVFVISSYSQNFTKAANNAFLISRMVEKFHVQPRTVDARFSDDWFNAILSSLDEDKIFFTTQDYNRLSAYRYSLQNQLNRQNTNFIQLLYTLYQSRLLLVDTLLENICKAPFNFTTHEIYSVKEDSSFAADEKSLKIKLNKYLKLQVLNTIVASKEEKNLKMLLSKRNIMIVLKLL